MLANEFGDFAARTRYENLPSAVTSVVKLRVLDVLAAALGSFHLGRHNELLPILDGEGRCTVWGAGKKFALRDATLANSFLSHALYLDDGSRFAGGHPSSVVIPSAVALAEARQMTGRNLIAAIAVGYEVFLRLARAIYPPAVKRGFQATSVTGAAASASACSNLLGFSAEQAKNALAIGCILGVGLKEASKSSASQPIQVARSCEGGVIAALFAEQGAVGADTVIERGFLKAFADRQSTPDLTAGLGGDFRIFETYTKIHGGCRGNHAPVDVVQDVVAKHDLRPEDIASIVVAVDSVTYAAEIHEPLNGNQAQFSVGFAVASALVNGDASVFRYTDANVADPRIRRVMAKIRVEVNTDYDTAYPDKRPASTEITLLDGRTVRGYLDNARGEPECPFGANEIKRKFLTLANDVLGKRCERVCELVMNLETIEDVGILTASLGSTR